MQWIFYHLIVLSVTKYMLRAIPSAVQALFRTVRSLLSIGVVDAVYA